MQETRASVQGLGLRRDPEARVHRKGAVEARLSDVSQRCELDPQRQLSVVCAWYQESAGVGEACCLNDRAGVVLAKVQLYHVERELWLFICF